MIDNEGYTDLLQKFAAKQQAAGTQAGAHATRYLQHGEEAAKAKGLQLLAEAEAWGEALRMLKAEEFATVIRQQNKGDTK